MPLVLALETSTLMTSAALLDGTRLVGLMEAQATPHSESLLPLIDSLLTQAGVKPGALDLIACGVGPGSFTGIRIGLATAKGLCFALSRPLVALSSLATLAQETQAHSLAANLVLSVVDARRGEVYACLYRVSATEMPVPLMPEALFFPEALAQRVRELAQGAPVIALGDGLAVAPELFAALGASPAGLRHTPSAGTLGALALRRWAQHGTDELATATPAYIRLSEAEAKFPGYLSA